MPLPALYPRKLADRERYQTVHKENGLAAAPTAGLHFTEELLEQIAAVFKLVYLTLHVGLGLTGFVDSLDDHEMHSLQSVRELPRHSVRSRERGRVIARTNDLSAPWRHYKNSRVLIQG